MQKPCHGQLILSNESQLAWFYNISLLKNSNILTISEKLKSSNIFFNAWRLYYIA